MGTTGEISLDDLRAVMSPSAFSDLMDRMRREKMRREARGGIIRGLSDEIRRLGEATSLERDDFVQVVRSVFETVEIDLEGMLIDRDGQRAAVRTRERKREGGKKRMQRTKEAAFRGPILELLAASGGEMHASELRPMLKNKMRSRLLPADLEPLPSNGEPR